MIKNYFSYFYQPTIVAVLFNENVIFYLPKLFIMSKKPFELLLVKTKPMSKMLLQCVTPNILG